MVKKLFLISAMVILTAGVVVLGVMYFSTKANLADTQIALEGKTSELNSMKVELASAQGELAETTGELTGITGDLADTKTQLDDKTRTLTATEAELNKTNNRLDEVKTELTAEKQENTTLLASNTKLTTDLNASNSEVTTLTQSIALYQETFGEVFAGVEPNYILDDTQPPAWNDPGPFNASIRFYELVNNPEAVNPTYAQVTAFVRADVTDSYRYVANYYMCGNFAETVHNHAEAAGIRTAVVFIQFEHGMGHAINAFLTTDRGLVYIDSTGSEVNLGANLDRIVQKMRINQDYLPTFLFPSVYSIIYDLNNPIETLEVYW
jgi:hypothetical protein